MLLVSGQLCIAKVWIDGFVRYSPVDTAGITNHQLGGLK
jgi:ATP-dependent helicase/DNAse subunit B